MALLSVNSLEKSFGERVLFSGVGFEVAAGDKIGFVGANGTGKTTLFKIITGALEPDGGMVVKARELSVGYMEQHACKDSSATALDEVLRVFSDLMEMERQIDALSELLLTDSSSELIERHGALTEQFQSAGGLTYLSRAKAALSGLGFSEEEAALPVSALSGGQRNKIALGRLLLSAPDLLLLDEPTNHLDIQSVEWLEEYIKGYKGAAIIISHDRFFLDRVCGRTFELEGGQLYVCDGNYTKYCEVKKLRRLSEERAYQNTVKEIERIRAIIAQQRQWNRERNIKMAESKEKQVARLEATLKKPEEQPEDIRFNFRIRKNCGNDVLTVRGLSKSFGGPELYSGVDFEIKKGERVFLIGPNGCGKTTLLEQLLTGGDGIRFGAGVETGYFEQTHSNLNPRKTALDEIWDTYKEKTQTEIRSALAVFLFRGDDVFKPIHLLSGGEQAKVALCKLMLGGSNLLLLDEPTNHLDLYSREALEGALSGYNGTLIMVSHDRYFINKLATKIVSFEQGGVQVYKGNYDNYLHLRSSPAEQPLQTSAGKSGGDYIKRKQNAAELRRLRAAVSKCELEIKKTESQIAEQKALLQNPEISCDYQKVRELSDEIAGLERHAEELLKNWEQLVSVYEERA